MKQLDKFLKEESPELVYSLKGKTIIGNISSLHMLKLASIQDKELDEQIAKTFEIVFGKENAEFMLENISPQGLIEISNDISKAFGVEEDSKK